MEIWQRIKQSFVMWFDIFRAMPKAMAGDPAAWEMSIKRFEVQDRLQPPPEGVIVFTGSSSVTFWSTLKQDMAPLPVINRGFGGSKIGDVVYYANRTVLPYHPRAVVLFAGTNDIAWPKPATAQQVFDGYLAFVSIVHATLPETPIYFVSITPTPSRWKYWPIVSEANRIIKAHAETDQRLHYIEMTPMLLGVDGRPEHSLYRLDRLHPNKKGYARWTATIKPILLADFGRK